MLGEQRTTMRVCREVAALGMVVAAAFRRCLRWDAFALAPLPNRQAGAIRQVVCWARPR